MFGLIDKILNLFVKEKDVEYDFSPKVAICILRNHFWEDVISLDGAVFKGSEYTVAIIPVYNGPVHNSRLPNRLNYRCEYISIMNMSFTNQDWFLLQLSKRTVSVQEVTDRIIKYVSRKEPEKYRFDNERRDEIIRQVIRQCFTTPYDLC